MTLKLFQFDQVVSRLFVIFGVPAACPIVSKVPDVGHGTPVHEVYQDGYHHYVESAGCGMRILWLGELRRLQVTQRVGEEAAEG